MQLMRLVLTAFVDDYLATAAWVTCDAGECTDFTRNAKKVATADCEKFIERVKGIFGEQEGLKLLCTAGNDLGYLAAHDLWLTRNGHGAGFWDKEDQYGERQAATLTTIAKTMGSCDVYHVRGKKSKLDF